MSVDSNKLTDSKTIAVEPAKRSIWARLWDILAEQYKGRWELKWSTYQGIAILVGIALVTIYAYYSQPSRGHVWAVCLLSGGVAFVFGVLVGFIFCGPNAAQNGNAPPLQGNPYKAN